MDCFGCQFCHVLARSYGEGFLRRVGNTRLEVWRFWCMVGGTLAGTLSLPLLEGM